ncbi:hypothetical protein K0M31_015502 [Melipona bicolor]|uniref:Uncharacterized protein n=1 Tax=Melipona bicolor TaxID=60889 RepID=A0AA40KF39_9HYME|nr:hypothetical protein K0M31_015502 [Melipona bicolor]
MAFDFGEKEKQQLDNIRAGLIDFVSGSLGGIALVYVGQPLDTIKMGIIRGLYAGTVPALVANVDENSVLFAAYGGCQKVISNILDIKKVEDLTSVPKMPVLDFLLHFSPH